MGAIAEAFVAYAQPLSRIAVMTTDRVTEREGEVLVRFGQHGVVAPRPLGDLVSELAATGRTFHVVDI